MKLILSNFPGYGQSIKTLGRLGLTALLAAGLYGRLAAGPTDFRQQVEADWVQQEESRLSSATPTTQSDAAGGCDGVKDGKWGFHTGLADHPWWQVDLGTVRPVTRVLVWNRCDTAERMSHIQLCLSDDGKQWQTVYSHNGTVFYGQTDGKPLEIKLEGRQARFVRLTLPESGYLHLDEIEVFGAPDSTENLALNHPADESGLSPWSKRHGPAGAIDFARRTRAVLTRTRQFINEAQAAGRDVKADEQALGQLTAQVDTLTTGQIGRDQYVAARWIQRRLTLANPLLDFDTILFAKRVPGIFSHMSDQYYGWFSRPGGGLYTLRGFREDAPAVACLSGDAAVKEPGSFLRPTLSYDGKKVLFAWCRHDPKQAVNPNKLDKSTVPEDAFYHVFEMNADGTGLRQLTHGKYDDFDAQYLPNGRIVFLSTRRGQSLQCDRDSAALTVANPALPDSYVRCGGDASRPVAVYTLHTMDAQGGDLNPISPFEMFEWTPTVADDGTILYSRWDYIDRWNMPWMSLWSVNPDGVNPRLVYGNFTPSPHCTFEPHSIPGSRKLVFTASGHHSQTIGSLVLLDPDAGTEGAEPIKRLTPEVCFPEIEGWPDAFYANPWPLSERLYLVTWGREGNISQGNLRSPNAQGLYVYDAAGDLELLYRDPAIGCENPIPLRPRPCPPALVDTVRRDAPKEGRFLVSDVYQGMKNVKRGEIKALRVVAVPAKTQPNMNEPSLGLTKDDPGKCVLGTTPVEADGSAYFRVPSGVIVFFQALDARGQAVQTMRTAASVQPGQTVSCSGCHESRQSAPAFGRPLAASHEPSKLAAGPEGSWPLRYDRLVQPVLDRQCVQCHGPSGEPQAAKFDLTAAKSYDALTLYGKPSLNDYVMDRYIKSFSVAGTGAAATSPLLAMLTAPAGHHDVRLSPEDIERLVTWMDTSAQKAGSFSPEQERALTEFRRACAGLLIEREPSQTTVAANK